MTTTYEPDAAWFTSGWSQSVLEGTDPGRLGRSAVDSSVPATEAACAVWPDVVSLGYVIGEGEDPRSHEPTAIYRVWRPTQAGLDAADAERLWDTMEPQSTWQVLMRDAEKSETAGFGLSSRESEWRYSLGQPVPHDALARVIESASSRGGLEPDAVRLLVGAERISWCLIRDDSGAVRAYLLNYPPSTTCFIDGERYTPGEGGDWTLIRGRMELRFTGGG